jgi:hypothetical protein
MIRRISKLTYLHTQCMVLMSKRYLSVRPDYRLNLAETSQVTLLLLLTNNPVAFPCMTRVQRCYFLSVPYIRAGESKNHSNSILPRDPVRYAPMSVHYTYEPFLGFPVCLLIQNSYTTHPHEASSVQPTNARSSSIKHSTTLKLSEISDIPLAVFRNLHSAIHRCVMPSSKLPIPIDDFIM